MTQPEIEKGSVAIALFMGATVRRIDHPNYSDTGFDVFDLPHGTFENGFLKYHSDWNWIMPVVEKIQSLGIRFVIGETIRVKVYSREFDWVNGHTTDPLIECVWHGCVAFAEFLNSQKTNAN